MPASPLPTTTPSACLSPTSSRTPPVRCSSSVTQSATGCTRLGVGDAPPPPDLPQPPARSTATRNTPPRSRRAMEGTLSVAAFRRGPVFGAKHRQDAVASHPQAHLDNGRTKESSMATTTHGIGWFEIGTDTPEPVEQFYGSVFGWTFTPDEGPMPYHYVTTPAPDSIRGGVFPTGGKLPNYAVLYVVVQDVAAGVGSAGAAGGKV